MSNGLGAPKFQAVGGNFFLLLAFGILLGIVIQSAFCVVGCGCGGNSSTPHKHETGGGNGGGGRVISPGPNP